MNACVIMHNMIIENDRGNDEDHTHYELMGAPVPVRRTVHRVPISLPRIIPFDPVIHMMSFKNILWKSGGNRMDNNSLYIFCII
jgi:hypothetical protein